MAVLGRLPNVGGVVWVVRPLCRVVENVLADPPEVVFTADDVLPSTPLRTGSIVPLPTGAPGVFLMALMRLVVADLNARTTAANDPPATRRARARAPTTRARMRSSEIHMIAWKWFGITTNSSTEASRL